MDLIVGDVGISRQGIGKFVDREARPYNGGHQVAAREPSQLRLLCSSELVTEGDIDRLTPWRLEEEATDQTDTTQVTEWRTGFVRSRSVYDPQRLRPDEGTGGRGSLTVHQRTTPNGRDGQPKRKPDTLHGAWL